jgi:hypothetical protein
MQGGSLVFSFDVAKDATPNSGNPDSYIHWIASPFRFAMTATGGFLDGLIV